MDSSQQKQRYHLDWRAFRAWRKFFGPRPGGFIPLPRYSFI